jgi:hypothetical protein
VTRANITSTAPAGGPPPDVVAQAAQHIAAAIAVLAPYLGAPHAPPSAEASRPAEPLVDRREIARLLSVSLAQIDRFSADGMPFLLVGECKRFEVAEVKAWFKARQGEGAQKATAPRALPASTSPAANDDRGPVRILRRANGGGR